MVAPAPGGQMTLPSVVGAGSLVMTLAISAMSESSFCNVRVVLLRQLQHLEGDRRHRWQCRAILDLLDQLAVHLEWLPTKLDAAGRVRDVLIQGRDGRSRERPEPDERPAPSNAAAMISVETLCSLVGELKAAA